MTVVFRVDSSCGIGTGHLMRCLALAHVMSEDGNDVVFVSRRLAGSLFDLPASCGFDVMETKSGPGAEDARATLEALRGRGVTAGCVVVDSYVLDADWERVVESAGFTVVVIDDLADRPHSCSVLLDQNLYHDADRRYEGLVPTGCRLLLGPRWALLRDEFGPGAAPRLDRDGSLRRVFVSYGGSDPSGETLKALTALAGVEGLASIDVLVGPACADPDAIDRQARRDARVCMHRGTERMAGLMREADLALGAGGTMSWERCASGLPTVVTAVADNQIEVAEQLALAGACVYLGMAEEVDAGCIAAAVTGLARDRVRLKAMADAAFAVIFGDGGFRGTRGVAAELMEACRAAAR